MGSVTGTIKVKSGHAIFELKGADRVWALKPRLVIPLKHIESVSTQKVDWALFPKQLRIGGTALPPLIKDGRYWDRKRGLMFYEMHNPDKVVTVGLKGERYKKIIFEVKDKEATAKKLLASVPGLESGEPGEVMQ